VQYSSDSSTPPAAQHTAGGRRGAPETVYAPRVGTIPTRRPEDVSGGWQTLSEGGVPVPNRVVLLLRPPYPDGTSRPPMLARLVLASRVGSTEVHARWLLLGVDATVEVTPVDRWQYAPPPPLDMKERYW
jgi:hypothetical protein